MTDNFLKNVFGAAIAVLVAVILLTGIETANIALACHDSQKTGMAGAGADASPCLQSTTLVRVIRGLFR